MIEPVIAVWIVAPIFHQTASMRDGGAVPLEQVTDLGQAHPTAYMGEIHRHLARKRCSRCRPGR